MHTCSARLALTHPSRSTHCSRLPAEVLNTVILCADRDDLSNLSLVCKGFAHIAQAILFEAISITSERARELVAAKTGWYHNIRTRLIPLYTVYLVITVDNPSIDSPAVGITSDDFIAIIRSCDKTRIRGLLLHNFAEPPHDQWLDMALAQAVADMRFPYSILSVGRCRWSIARLLISPAVTLPVFKWISKPSNRLIPEVRVREPSPIQLPSLQHLDWTGQSMDDIPAEGWQALLETIAPRIVTITLDFIVAVDDLAGPPIRIKHDVTFPMLRKATICNIPHDVFDVLMRSAPKLDIICIHGMNNREDSVLSVLPTRLQGFAVGRLDLIRDPPHLLLGQMKRFGRLKILPLLLYQIPDEGEHHDLDVTRGELLAHFDSLGILSTPEERERMLDYASDED